MLVTNGHHRVLYFTIQATEKYSNSNVLGKSLRAHTILPHVMLVTNGHHRDSYFVVISLNPTDTIVTENDDDDA